MHEDGFGSSIPSLSHVRLAKPSSFQDCGLHHQANLATKASITRIQVTLELPQLFSLAMVYDDILVGNSGIVYTPSG